MVATEHVDVVLADGFVPVIDVAPARRGDRAGRLAVGRAIDRACRESGFFVVVGHGVDPGLVAAMHDVTLAFFLMDPAFKRQWAATPGDPTIRGLFATSSSVAAAEDVVTAPDLCELFTVNRLGEPGVAAGAGLGDDFAVWSKPNVWPDTPADFRAIWLDYYAALEALSLDVMRAIALGLELEEDFFDGFLDEHISNQTANWYMPVREPPLSAQFRKGPHSDWGTLTVLYHDGVRGLQVIDHRGEWIDVPSVPGGFVVNIGDLMSVWTNDAYVSTKHRVVVPDPADWDGQRISVPFFHQPNWSALIECLPSCQGPGNPPRHEPVTSGGYLLAKIRAAFG